VDDIIAANIHLLETDRADGTVLNVGGGRRITVNQLFGHLKDITGSDMEPVYSNEIKGDAKHTLSNTELAKELIGYEAKTRIESGLTRFVEWFQENPEFYSV
jgi:nucleoside-diphosphate-sugar epimerase